MNGDVDVITPQLEKQTLEDKNGEKISVLMIHVEFVKVFNLPQQPTR